MSNIKTQVYRPRQSSFVDKMTNSNSTSKLQRPSSGYRYTNTKMRPSTASFVNFSQMKTEHKYENININIIEQIGGRRTNPHESDAHIERLKQQCEMQNKDLFEDNDVDALEEELEQLKLQLSESVAFRNQN